MDVKNQTHALIRTVIRTKALLTDGWKYKSPVRPDRILWLDPDEITCKPINKPSSSFLRGQLIVGGSWDQNLSRIDDDIVYKSLYKRYVGGKNWDETGYIDFLSTDVSEHGGVSRVRAKERCKQLDKLYEYVQKNGYKTQVELQQKDELIGGLTTWVVPPRFREISVGITRNGEFVWFGGFHRLVITKILGVPEVPVRVHMRHKQWQAIREDIYIGKEQSRFRDHKDIRYLI